MQTYWIDLSDLIDAAALHKRLALLLRLPSHYGMNFDALYDCLTDRRRAARFILTGQPGPGLAQAADTLARVLADAGQTVLIDR